MSITDPLKDIVGAKSLKLKGKRIAFCVTGSVAAIESPRIARELMRNGAEVHAVMSNEAQRIIHHNVMEWATGNPSVVELTGNAEHLRLAGRWRGKVDLVIIAPSTANTIGKIASGIDDTAVTTVVTCALGSKIPLIIAPAMHLPMYENAVVEENMAKLKARGVHFVEPIIDEDKAKMASVDEIVEAVLSELSEKDMQGLNILITAGPTREYLDPVRIITNKSSGKMGVALASEAVRRGGTVTLIYGPGWAQVPNKVKLIKVETTAEMYDAVHSALKCDAFDILIAAAAPADFTSSHKSRHKLSSRGADRFSIDLKATPKIVNIVKDISPSTFLVVFKTQYHLVEKSIRSSAKILFKEAQADMVMVNDISRQDIGFESDNNEIHVVMKSGKVITIPFASKNDVASRILDIIIEALSRG